MAPRTAWVIAAAAVATAAVAGMGRAAEPAPLCLDCITVRVGPPMVVRGPFPDELDNHFTALRLPDGTFRGFTANGATYAVDGPDVRAMGGVRRTVMEPVPGSDECGRWLNGVAEAGGRLYGFVHIESGCDYEKGETHKSMAVAVSNDDGLTWTDLGPMLAGADGAKPRTITGEGDCTVTPGGDGFLYAYCLRNRDWKTIVARAPADDPRPGNWRKYLDGQFSSDALGGDATAIGFLGTGSGYLRDLGRIATVTVDPWFRGLRLSLSADGVTFTDFAVPLLPVDAADWQRPAPTGLMAYATLIDPDDATAVLGSRFLLAYIYVPPGKDFADRYLVFQEVRLAVGAGPAAVPAAVALARWRSGTAFATGTTPVVDPAFRLDRTLGSLLTAAGEAEGTVALSECVAADAGRPGSFLAPAGRCGAGARAVATAGWAFAGERPGTRALYACVAGETRFASDAADCEGLGTPEFRLGYVLDP